MIGRRDRGDDGDPADAPSPWATGEIGVEPAPPEIEWSTFSSPAANALDELPTRPPPNRRGVIAGAAAVVALLLIAAVVLWPRGDDQADDASDPDAAPTTLGTLPESADDEVTTTAPPPDDEPDPDGGSEATDLLDLPSGPGVVWPDEVELPVALVSAQQPTEIVMTTERGLATLSLPSGRLRYAIVGDESMAFGSPLVVAPDATALTSPTGQFTIVPRTGLPIVVSEFDPTSTTTGDPGGFDGFFARGWTTRSDGATVFQVVAFNAGGEQSFLVDMQGTVTPTDSPSSLGGSFTYDIARSNGRTVVNDAGGVYLIDAEGSARRITLGRAFAANGDFVLLRECDEALQCQLVVDDYVTGDRRVVTVPVDFVNAWSLDLAPDGDAFSAIATGDDGQETLQIVDLVTGTVTGDALAASVYFNPGSMWLADGSGIMQANPSGPGLVFLDRASGDTIAFGALELGRVSSIGLRYPEAELPASVGPATVSELTFSAGSDLESGLDLVVLGSGGNMALLDLDGGAATAWITPELPNRQTPELFVDGDAVVAVADSEGFVARIGSADPIDTDTAGFPSSPRVRGPASGEVWVRREGATLAVDHVLVPLSPNGPGTANRGPTPLSISIPDVALLGSDGRGGLVVEGAGGVFVATPDTRTRLTTGALLALGQNHALVRECDEQLTCRTLLRERETGEITTELAALTADDGTQEGAPAISAEDAAPVAGTLSPNGDFVLTRLAGDRSTWSSYDFVTAATGTLPAPADRQPLVWSDDGGTLAYVSVDGDLVVYDRRNGRIELVEGLGTVEALVRVTDEFAATGATTATN